MKAPVFMVGITLVVIIAGAECGRIIPKERRAEIDSDLMIQLRRDAWNRQDDDSYADRSLSRVKREEEFDDENYQDDAHAWGLIDGQKSKSWEDSSLSSSGSSSEEKWMENNKNAINGKSWKHSSSSSMMENDEENLFEEGDIDQNSISFSMRRKRQTDGGAGGEQGEDVGSLSSSSSQKSNSISSSSEEVPPEGGEGEATLRRWKRHDHTGHEEVDSSSKEGKDTRWKREIGSRQKRGNGDSHITTTAAPEEEEDEESSEESEESERTEHGGRGGNDEGSNGGGNDADEADEPEPAPEPEPIPEPAPKPSKKRRRKKPRSAGLETVVLQDNSVLFPDSSDGGATNCQVGGYWYNHLGSEVLLHQHYDGSLRGEFRTAVESECGSAGSNFTDVKGHVHGKLVTFQAFFVAKDGKRSMTAWTGQCHQACNFGYMDTRNTGEIVLHTTWMLTQEEESCDDAWGQNRIGQNIFTRKELVTHGPRKLKGTHIPKRESRSD